MRCESGSAILLFPRWRPAAVPAVSSSHAQGKSTRRCRWRARRWRTSRVTCAAADDQIVRCRTCNACVARAHTVHMTVQPLDFTGLRALFINCTLKRSPEISNTQGLIDISARIMEMHGIEVDVIRAIDHDIATGVWSDMREHGWATDDWPMIFEKVLGSDILVLAGPIWLGDDSSVMK